MSSGSNIDDRHNPSSASISTMRSSSVWNASGRWSRPEKRVRLRTRRSPRIARMSDAMFLTPRSAIARTSATRGGAAVAFTAESSTPVIEPDVVGEQRTDVIPAAVGKERVRSEHRRDSRRSRAALADVDPRTGHARRRARRSRRRCLRCRTTPAARFGLPRRCRTAGEIRPAAPQGSRRQCPTPIE